MAAADGAEADPSLPEIYNFPPFFTIQPNDTVRAKQLNEWRGIVVRWHEARKESVMRVADWPMWSNDRIGRRLSPEGVRAVMDHLVAAGNCEWADEGRTTARVFYKTPAEWAAIIIGHMRGIGATGSTYIVFDLVEGDAAPGAPFRGLDAKTIVKALGVLERDGHAEVFPHESPKETGVQFLPG